jgi:hypothetical protein
MAKKSGKKKSLKLNDLKPNKNAKGGGAQHGDSSGNPQRGVSALTLNHNETFLRN